MTNMIKKRSCFLQSLHNVFSNYANFTGRATRGDFWFLCLFSFIIHIISFFIIFCFASILLLMSIAYLESGDKHVVYYYVFCICFYVWIVSLATFFFPMLPIVTTSVRRLHDVGRSGWWLLLTLTVVGTIPLFIFFCLKSQPHDNDYGPAPLA